MLTILRSQRLSTVKTQVYVQGLKARYNHLTVIMMIAIMNDQKN